MRVLQVSSADIAGGAERVAMQLHESLPASGHSTTLVVGHRHLEAPGVLELPSEGGVAQIGRVAEKVARLAGRQDVFHPSSHHLERLLPEGWDVAILHNLHGRYFDVAAVRRLRAVAPVILVLHDQWLLTGHCAHPLECERWQTGCGSCPDLTLYPSVRRDGTAANHRRKRRHLHDLDVNVVSPGRWVLENVARSPILGHAPQHHIPNMVDLDVFTPGDRAAAAASLGLPADRPIVLFPARFAMTSPYKDAATVLGAIDRLEGSAHLVTFGDVAEKIGEHTTVLAPVTDPAVMADHFRAAAVIVQASKAEVFGLTVIEAAACARPVVVTGVGGLREIVEHEVTGLIVPPNDVTAMTAAIRGLLADPQRAAAIGARARSEVMATYGSATVIDQWDQLLRSVVG